jgi:hypothetical protein
MDLQTGPCRRRVWSSDEQSGDCLMAESINATIPKSVVYALTTTGPATQRLAAARLNDLPPQL